MLEFDTSLVYAGKNRWRDGGHRYPDVPIAAIHQPNALLPLG